MPKLSVIIPCFNKAEYLIEMIETIELQTFTDWELIIVDDGSEEVNFQKIRECANIDDRIQYIKRTRLPKNGDTCRNIGMDIASGEYLIIFDADDIISQTCFENRVAFMDQHPECDYATFPAASFIDGTSKFQLRSFDPSIDNLIERILSGNYPFTVWANIYKREALVDIRWDENLYIYQDFDFMFQCAQKELRHLWADSKEPDYFYRLFKNGNSVCSNVISEQKVISTNYLFDKTLNTISKESKNDHLLKAYFKFAMIQLEQLLLSNKTEYINSFVDIIINYYPSKGKKLNRIVKLTEDHTIGHYNLFKLYKRLYSLCGESIYRNFMIHEFVKIFIIK